MHELFKLRTLFQTPVTAFISYTEIHHVCIRVFTCSLLVILSPVSHMGTLKKRKLMQSTLIIYMSFWTFFVISLNFEIVYGYLNGTRTFTMILPRVLILNSFLPLVFKYLDLIINLNHHHEKEKKGHVSSNQQYKKWNVLFISI